VAAALGKEGPRLSSQSEGLV